MAGSCLTTILSITMRHLTKTELRCCPCFYQRRLSAMTYNASVSQLLTADSLLSSSLDSWLTQLRVRVSELLYNWWFTINQFGLVPSPLRLTAINFFSTEPLRSLSLCNTLSDERVGLSFAIDAGSCQSSHSWVWVPQDSRSYFSVSDPGSPNLEGQVPIFVSPKNRMAQ
jgi:hypothetical protein